MRTVNEIDFFEILLQRISQGTQQLVMVRDLVLCIVQLIVRLCW
jgi:hypothetical protein